MTPNELAVYFHYRADGTRDRRAEPTNHPAGVLLINGFLTNAVETLPAYLGRLAAELAAAGRTDVPVFFLITTPGGSVEYRPAVRFADAAALFSDPTVRRFALAGFPRVAAKRRFVELAPAVGVLNPDGTADPAGLRARTADGVSRDDTRAFPGFALVKRDGGTTFVPIVRAAASAPTLARIPAAAAPAVNPPAAPPSDPTPPAPPVATVPEPEPAAAAPPSDPTPAADAPARKPRGKRAADTAAG